MSTYRRSRGSAPHAVVDPGRNLRLAPEPPLKRLILGEMRGQRPEGIDAVGRGVAGLMDLAHSAPSISFCSR